METARMLRLMTEGERVLTLGDAGFVIRDRQRAVRHDIPVSFDCASRMFDQGLVLFEGEIDQLGEMMFLPTAEGRRVARELTLKLSTGAGDYCSAVPRAA